MARDGKEIAAPKGPTLPMLLLVAAVSAGSAGCAWLAKAAIPAVVAFVSEATKQLDVVDATQGAWFKAHPDPEKQLEVEKALAKCRDALAAAEHGGAGADHLTQGRPDAAFADFRKAWDELERVTATIRGLRYVRPGESLLAAEPGGIVVVVPAAALGGDGGSPPAPALGAGGGEGAPQ
jgi:hypothetical protein